MTLQFKSFILIVLLCILGLLFCSSTRADTLYIWQWSHHITPGSEIVRQNHPLLIYEWNTGKNIRPMAGYWRNSLDKNTFSIGFHDILYQKGRFSAGFKAGVVTGYRLPVFGALNLQYSFIDINILPTVVSSIGFKFDF